MADELKCKEPEARQFDFWIGEWTVQADGKKAGDNSITLIHGGCALREEWRSASGGTGSSLNAWDSRTRTWRQTWVSSMGPPLLLEGGLDGEGRMVMTGEGSDEQGRPVRNRITWSREREGRVRQLWEQSTPDGKWSIVFDGLYSRK
jgi:hypothetical protein